MNMRRRSKWHAGGTVHLLDERGLARSPEFGYGRPPGPCHSVPYVHFARLLDPPGRADVQGCRFRMARSGTTVCVSPAETSGGHDEH